jgi:hypothetical protein
MAQTPTDTTAEEAYDAVDTALGGALTLAENLLITDQPWLGLPVIKQIWESILGFYFGYVQKALGTQAGIFVINDQISVEENNFNLAKAMLSQAQAGGNTDAISKARANMDSAAMALANYNGNVTS